jgi:hypothetical protein
MTPDPFEYSRPPASKPQMDEAVFKVQMKEVIAYFFLPCAYVDIYL